MSETKSYFSVQLYNLNGERLAATMPDENREAAEYITDQINHNPRLGLKAAVQVVGSSSVDINGAGAMIGAMQ